MDNIKSIVTGTIITLIVGGTAYTISQEDVAKNFANDSGLTQEQAEQYINAIPEDELVSWNEIGSQYVVESQELVDVATEIDCENYEYEWESATLSCIKGKGQMEKLGRDSKLLGQAYIKLGSDSASTYNMSETIKFIDQLNSDYSLEIVRFMLDSSTIDELKKTNLYNKSLLKTILESE